jgi:hypothetical protein
VPPDKKQRGGARRGDARQGEWGAEGRKGGDGGGRAFLWHGEDMGADWSPPPLPTAVLGGADQTRLTKFKLFENPLNFERSNKYFPLLRKIQIKYGFEDFEDMDNFLHRNFFRFELDFDGKFRKF